MSDGMEVKLCAKCVLALKERRIVLGRDDDTHELVVTRNKSSSSSSQQQQRSASAGSRLKTTERVHSKLSARVSAASK
jgi:hypothetical protein